MYPGKYRKVLDDAINADNAFRPTLTEEQKKLFENLLDARRKISILTDAETFIYVYRLPARIMIDVLIDGQMREI